MTKQKSTKRTLLMSGLALLMCISMLIGSTFAWFTDSVTSGGNKIVSGKLDVQLLMHDGSDYADISDSDKPIFGAGSIAQNNNAETLWEPGKTQVAYLAIRNNGNLALKYKVALDVQNVSKDLYKVMEYAITPGAQNDSVAAWAGNGNNVVVGTQSVSGEVSLGVGDTHYFALSIHMDEGAGNEYQGGEVSFDLTVLATQDTAESDSFDDQYDAGAKLPVIASASTQAELAAAISDGADTIYLAAGTYTLPSTSNSEIAIIGDESTVIDITNSVNMSGSDITFDGVTVRSDNGGFANGIQHVNTITYENATIVGSRSLYGEKEVFNNCTFDLTGISDYIWTYGAKEVEFNNCVFNTQGKAILVYNEGTVGSSVVSVNGCTFYATNSAYTGAGDRCAAVEIDGSLIPGTYTVNFNGTNTVSDKFAGISRIKAQKDPSNVTVNQNGTVVTTDLVLVSGGLLTDVNGDFYVFNAAGLEALHAWYTDTTDVSYNMRKAFWGKTYSLMADIDASGVTWKTVKTGMDSATSNGITFNGNGYTISNLTIEGNGMFTGATQGTQAGTTLSVVKDVTFDNVTVTGASHHNGVVWGEVIGSITLENVNVISSKVSGGCNVGGLIGRNSESHANITFKNCSVKNTTVEATKVADYAGASAFLGNALHIGTSCSANVVFDGTNVAEGNTLTTAEGMQGGGIYTIATWGEATWETPTVVATFTNYNSNN